jgi:hypothetical protein
VTPVNVLSLLPSATSPTSHLLLTLNSFLTQLTSLCLPITRLTVRMCGQLGREGGPKIVEGKGHLLLLLTQVWR